MREECSGVKFEEMTDFHETAVEGRYVECKLLEYQLFYMYLFETKTFNRIQSGGFLRRIEP